MRISSRGRHFLISLAISATLWGPSFAEPTPQEMLHAGKPEHALGLLREEAGDEAWIWRTEALLLLSPADVQSRYLLERLAPLPPTPHTLLLRGLLHLRTAEWQPAEKVLRGCHDAPTATPVLRARSACALGRLELRRSQPEAARKWLTEAQHAAPRVDDPQLWLELADVQSQLHSVGRVGQPDWSSYAWLAELFRQRQIPSWEAACLRKLAQSTVREGDGTEYLRTVQRAAQLWEEAGSPEALRVFLDEAGRLHLPAAAAAARLTWLDEKIAASHDPAIRFAYAYGRMWGSDWRPEQAQALVNFATTPAEQLLAWKMHARITPGQEGLDRVAALEQQLHSDPVQRASQRPPDPMQHALEQAELWAKTRPQQMRQQLWLAYDLHQQGKSTWKQDWNLLLTMERRLAAAGFLDDQLKVREIRWQGHQHDRVRQVVTFYNDYAPEPDPMVELTSGWPNVFRRSYLRNHGDKLRAYEREILQQIEKARAKGENFALPAHYGEVAEYLCFCERWNEALQAQRRASALSDTRSSTVRDLARLLAAQGQKEEALSAFQTAVAADRQEGWGEASWLLKEVAGMHRQLAHWDKAEAALDEAQSSLGENHYGQSFVDLARVELLKARGEPQAALKLLQGLPQGPPGGLERLGRLLHIARLQKQIGGYALAAPTVQEAIALARSMGSGAPARVALVWGADLPPDEARQLRADAAEALLRSAKLFPPDCLPDFFAQRSVRELFREHLADLGAEQQRELLARAPLLQSVPLPDPTRIRPLTRAEFTTRLNELREQEPDLESLLPMTTSALVDLQGRLGPQQVLLSFCPVGQRIVVLGCAREGWLLRSVLLEKSELHRMVLKLRSQVAASQKVSEELYGLLLQPWEPWLKDRDLWLAPRGTLWYLPWNMLCDKNGRYALQLWRSQQLWLGTSSAPALRKPPGGALLIGAPGSSKLGGVQRELAAISPLLPGFTRLLGAQATAANLRRRVASSPLLHIAAHSRVAPNKVNESFIELSDGPIKLAQLLVLPFAPNSLVVLSSCDTAVGQQEPGLDVSSLGSAFRVSGARAVLSTLWEVDDECSAEFFTHFYGAWSKGQTLERSLNVACRAMLGNPKFRKPYFWASYQLESKMPGVF